MPVYEQLVVDVAIKTARVGGQDLTKFMSTMLLSRKDDSFANLVEKKQLDVARRLKERQAFVAPDFEEQVGHQATLFFGF